MPTLRSVATKVAVLAAAIVVVNAVIRPVIEMMLDECDRAYKEKR